MARGRLPMRGTGIYGEIPNPFQVDASQPLVKKYRVRWILALLLLHACPIIVTARGTASSTPDAANPPLQLALVLSDGSVVIGTPSVDHLKIAGYANVEIAFSQLDTIEFSDTDQMAKISFQNGDQVSGRVIATKIALKTIFGQVVIPMAEVRTIRPEGSSMISIVGGTDQAAGHGIFLKKPLIVAVRLPDKAPGAGIPVTFQVSSAGGSLAASPGDTVASSTDVTTDTNGQASIYFACPPSGPEPFFITATTGTSPHTSSVRFKALLAKEKPIPAPSNVIARFTGAGTVYIVWTNNDNGAAVAYDVERSTDNLTWQVIATVKPTSVKPTSVFIDQSPPKGKDAFYRINSKAEP
jgi:hypothetical protein